MTRSRAFSGFAWTAVTILASAVVRFGQNIVLSRLLVPEILGVIVVVNSVRMGIELLSDVGIEQNIIHHPDGETRGFRDTAWTMQVGRGLLLGGTFAALSPWLSGLYGIDARVFLLAACAPVLSALHSTAIFVQVRRLEVRCRSLFELGTETLTALVTVALALLWRSVWAPVAGLVVGAAMRAALSYLLPDPAQRPAFDRAVAARIMRFGRWIALTSLVMYGATNVDRLYLGQVAPLAMLGIYGIARSFAEMPTTLSRRIAYQVIFPALAGSIGAGNIGAGDAPGQRHARIDHGDIGRTRLLFVFLACGGIAGVAGCADWLIALFYDPRYHAAGWMLAVLLLGGVFAVLSNLNEAILLAAGRPGYSSAANLARLATLGLGLAAGFTGWGMAGAVIAVAAAEAFQYLYIAIGQLRVGRGFWRSDLAALACAAVVLALVLAIRAALGLGSPFAAMGSVGP